MLRRLLGVILSLACGTALAQTPSRIVSLNPCLDAILVELVPHERIAAISYYSRDPMRSTIARLAQTLPITYETAEEIIARKPDMVLFSRHSALATRNALQRVGVRFELFDVPKSVTESLTQIRALARLLEREPQGDLLIARIEQELSAARAIPGEPVFTAAIYQPGGLTAGSQTVTGELMKIAGLENIAARYGVTTYRTLSLEALLAAPPQILLVGEATEGSAMQAERVVQHRALRALAGTMQQAPFPARLLYCAGPTMIDSIRQLASARQQAARSLMLSHAP